MPVGVMAIAVLKTIQTSLRIYGGIRLLIVATLFVIERSTE